MTLFTRPKHQYLADIVSLGSPALARDSVRKLLSEYKSAHFNYKRLRVARATNLAGTRAKIIAVRRQGLSGKERHEFHEIAKIYRDAAQTMFLWYATGR